MTHKKPDWADEIAEDWDPAPAIAAALRKAKADGLRELMARNDLVRELGSSDIWAILELAAKIERGGEP